MGWACVQWGRPPAICKLRLHAGVVSTGNRAVSGFISPVKASNGGAANPGVFLERGGSVDSEPEIPDGE